jgi:hypothetical protein
MAQPDIVFAGKDANEDGAIHHVRQRGSSVDEGGGPIDCIPMLLVQKDNDTLNHIQSRPELDPVAGNEGIPVFAFKKESDSSWIWPVTNDEGHMVITSEGTKTPISLYMTKLSTALNTFEQMNAINLGLADTRIDDLELVFSSPKDCILRIDYVDDSGGGGETTTNVMDIYMYGGAPRVIDLSCLDLDISGGTGAQELSFEVSQERGSLETHRLWACVKRAA